MNMCEYVCSLNMQICYMYMHTSMCMLMSVWRTEKDICVLFYHSMSHPLETAPLYEYGAKLAARKSQWVSYQCLGSRLMWSFIADFLSGYLDPNLGSNAYSKRFYPLSPIPGSTVTFEDPIRTHFGSHLCFVKFLITQKQQFFFVCWFFLCFQLLSFYFQTWVSIT